jgi:integrase
MVHVRLKGIAKATKKLASGKTQTYWYAWRGGPRLDGQPGTPDFIASYHAAVAKRSKPSTVESLSGLIRLYEKSTDYPKGESTRRDYKRYLTLIEAEFGDLPIEALKAPEVRGDFKEWRDGMQATPRKADYAWSVLVKLLNFAVDRGKIAVNPCARGGRLSDSDRTEKVWTDEHIARLLAHASAEVALVCWAALWTGQRQGDLLALTRANVKDGVLRLKQGKTGRKVALPVPAPLADGLTRARTAKGETALFLNSRGKPWTEDGFRASFGKSCEVAGIEDLTFHDMRGTFASRAAQAGCTIVEIAAVTGHAVPGGGALDSTYIHRSLELATTCIRRLEAQEAGKVLQTGLQTVAFTAEKCKPETNPPTTKKRSDLNDLGSVVGDVGLEPTTR